MKPVFTLICVAVFMIGVTTHTSSVFSQTTQNQNSIFFTVYQGGGAEFGTTDLQLWKYDVLTRTVKFVGQRTPSTDTVENVFPKSESDLMLSYLKNMGYANPNQYLKFAPDYRVETINFTPQRDGLLVRETIALCFDSHRTCFGIIRLWIGKFTVDWQPSDILLEIPLHPVTGWFPSQCEAIRGKSLLGSILVDEASWSPDGSFLLFSTRCNLDHVTPSFYAVSLKDHRIIQFGEGDSADWTSKRDELALIHSSCINNSQGTIQNCQDEMLIIDNKGTTLKRIPLNWSILIYSTMQWNAVDGRFYFLGHKAGSALSVYKLNIEEAGTDLSSSEMQVVSQVGIPLSGIDSFIWSPTGKYLAVSSDNATKLSILDNNDQLIASVQAGSDYKWSVNKDQLWILSDTPSQISSLSLTSGKLENIDLGALVQAQFSILQVAL